MTFNQDRAQPRRKRSEAIRLVPGVTERDMPALLAWANAGGPDFLRQFAGPKWAYPLTETQILAEGSDLCSVFEDGAFSGIVQVLLRREGSVRIGRFLLNPERGGRGLGMRTLTRFCAMLFEDGSVDTIQLNVYRFNESARRCYQSCGFEFVDGDAEGDPWDSRPMALTREAFRQRVRDGVQEEL